MVRMDIQPRNWLRRRQGDRQLQFCVPLVTTSGESYRMREARTTQGGHQNKS